MIEQFTVGLEFNGFREDPKTVAAVERKLLVISEAAIRLGSEAEARCPGLAWPEIRGIGNWAAASIRVHRIAGRLENGAL